VAASVGSFLFGWYLTNARGEFRPHEQGRVVGAVFAAVLMTTSAMWVGVRDQGYGSEIGKANSPGRGLGNQANREVKRRRVEGQAVGAYGYQSIILWPLAPKREILAPLPPKGAVLGVQIRKAVTIRFDGSYWYFQPPETGPGLHAHVTHGDPLKADIRSTDFMPLVMEAHQELNPPIRISRCGEIQVIIENRDDRPGNISVGMLLTDSADTRRPPLYLGQHSITSNEPNQLRLKHSPVEENLRFSLPGHSAIHKFNQITVVVTPDGSRLEIGARIAVRQFMFLPR
jgi:hypothetical protein